MTVVTLVGILSSLAVRSKAQNSGYIIDLYNFGSAFLV